MTPDLLAEILKQAPAVGVGLFVFLAYQKLVMKLQEIIAASTAAMVASTAAMQALTRSVEEAMARANDRHEKLVAEIAAVPAKVPHELANAENVRGLRERLGR